MKIYLKSVIYMLLFIFFFLSSISCIMTNEEGIDQDTVKSSDTIYALGEKFSLNNNTFIIEESRKMKSIENHKPLEGNQFIMVYLSFEGDISNQPVNFDPAAIKVMDSRATLFDAYEPSEEIDILSKESKRKPLGQCLINSSDKVKSVEIFEVPDTAVDLKLVFIGWEKNKLEKQAIVDLELE